MLVEVYYLSPILWFMEPFFDFGRKVADLDASSYILLAYSIYFSQLCNFVWTKPFYISRFPPPNEGLAYSHLLC